MKTIQCCGRTVVSPVLLSSRELSHPLEGYFPNGDPKKWFSWEGTTQNAWVRDQFDGACVIYGHPRDGERVETHHFPAKGIGGKKLSCVPWAMIPVMKSFERLRSAHDLLQSGTWKIRHYDPLDQEAGLRLRMTRESWIQHRKMYFYRRPTPERIAEAAIWKEEMLSANQRYVLAAYELATLGELGSNETHYETLGAETLFDWAAQHGIRTQILRAGQRVYKRAGTMSVQKLMRELVPIEIADYTMLTVPKEDRQKWIAKLIEKCSPQSEHPSEADFISEVKETHPDEAQKQPYTIVPFGTACSPRREADYNKLLAEGVVIKGHPIGGLEESRAPGE